MSGSSPNSSYSGEYPECTFFVRAFVPAFKGLGKCTQFKAVAGTVDTLPAGATRYVIISDTHTGIVDGDYFYDVQGGHTNKPVRSKKLAEFQKVLTAYMGTSALKYFVF